MERIGLSEYIELFGQSAAAAAIGVTQSAVSTMIKNHRSVWLEVKAPGGKVVRAYEEKPLGKFQ